MTKLLRSLVLGVVAASAFVATTAAHAAEKATANEAVALVQKAVAFYKTNGKEKALAEFSKTDGQFKPKDLYLLVHDVNGVVVAHGGNQKLIGKNLIEVKDSDGKLMTKEMIETAKSKGKGWVDYRWPNPTTKAVEAKSTYFEKVDDIVIGAGIYK